MVALKIIDSDRSRKDREYVSFSEIYLFESCPYKHNKSYNEGEREPFTFYTVYGTSIHEAIEQKWKYQNDLAWLKMGKIVHLISRLDLDETGKFRGNTPKEWVKTAFRIYSDFFPFIEKNFPGCELYDIEMELSEPLDGFDRDFKGFIDLILHDKEKDIYHIIDLKTAGWGWDSSQLADTKKLYQVILYKHFFCKKTGIDPEKVNTHYVLMLRAPAKNAESAVVLHSTSSGNKKMQNAVKWMEQTIGKIKRGIKLKTPETCTFCICGVRKKQKFKSNWKR